MKKNKIHKKELLEALGNMDTIVNSTGARKVATLLSEINGRKYNLLKLAEELAELQELCLKMHNKKGPNKPEEQLLIDEIGDVAFRLRVLQEGMNINRKSVLDRIIYKANKYIGYANEGSYSKI